MEGRKTTSGGRRVAAAAGMPAHEHPWRVTVLATTAGLLLMANLAGCGGSSGGSGGPPAAPSTRSSPSPTNEQLLTPAPIAADGSIYFAADTAVVTP